MRQTIAAVGWIIAALAMGCASWFNTIDSVTVMRPVPPWQGPVEVRLPESKPTSPAIFEMRVLKNEFGGLPQGEFLEEIKQEGARNGANIMVFDCAPAGTVGQRVCTVHGYREQ